MNQLPEIKIIIAESDLIPADLKIDRQEYIENADAIKSVTTAEQNTDAGELVVAIRKHVKTIESMRAERTRPLLDAQKILKAFYDSHTETLQSEINRLQSLGKAYIESENKRVEAEEKKRREDFEEAQRVQFALDDAARKAAESGSTVNQMLANRKLETAKANVQAIIATPEPEANRAKGQTLKKKLCFEVTDILALVKARPDLCDIQPKKSAINAVCGVNLPPIPGLRLWEESVSTYTTR